MTFYVPRHFRIDDRETLERFVEAHAFGALVSAGPAGFSVSHIPFLPERGADGRLRLLGHVARANAHWQELEAAGEVLVIFEGPHAYVSPGWYANHPSVPTWNYAVVHAHGTARLLAPQDLAPLLDRLSRTYEDDRQSPWRMESLPADYTPKLLEAIVAFEIAVDRLEGKFKLSQNRRPEDVEGVAAALEAEGQESLAGLMRAHAARPHESR
ncbi:MAG: FMN-binding negative transcriptional regulator [Betaproteobacteria bacterium]|nr:FMN-binding negative transcriptional regulator [Betaproteobacteria bacterium]